MAMWAALVISECHPASAVRSASSWICSDVAKAPCKAALINLRGCLGNSAPDVPSAAARAAHKQGLDDDIAQALGHLLYPFLSPPSPVTAPPIHSRVKLRSFLHFQSRSASCRSVVNSCSPAEADVSTHTSSTVPCCCCSRNCQPALLPLLLPNCCHRYRMTRTTRPKMTGPDHPAAPIPTIKNNPIETSHSTRLLNGQSGRQG